MYKHYNVYNAGLRNNIDFGFLYYHAALLLFVNFSRFLIRAYEMYNNYIILLD